MGAPLPDTRADFGRMLRDARHARRFTLDALAAATGISKPYLSNIETARGPGVPTPDKLARLEKALQLPLGTLARAADWLRTPAPIRAMVIVDAALARRPDGAIDLDALLAGTATFAPPANSPPAPPVAPELPLKWVPLINRVAAGPVAEFTDLDYPVGVADRYIPVAEQDPGNAGPAEEGLQASFALEVMGDSMVPDYDAGDLVVFAAATPRHGDDCLVRLGERENFATTFKRVYFVPEGVEEPTHIRLVPLNPHYRERTVDREDVTGLFPAIWKMTAVRHNGVAGAAQDPRRRPDNGA